MSFKQLLLSSLPTFKHTHTYCLISFFYLIFFRLQIFTTLCSGYCFFFFFFCLTTSVVLSLACLVIVFLPCIIVVGVIIYFCIIFNGSPYPALTGEKTQTNLKRDVRTKGREFVFKNIDAVAAAADLFWGIKKPTKQTKDETPLSRVSFVSFVFCSCYCSVCVCVWCYSV